MAAVALQRNTQGSYNLKFSLEHLLDTSISTSRGPVSNASRGLRTLDIKAEAIFDKGDASQTAVQNYLTTRLPLEPRCSYKYCLISPLSEEPF